MFKKFALLLAAMAFSVGGVSAATLACADGITDISTTLAPGADDCELGGLIFSDFTLSGTGTSIDINMAPETGIFGDTIVLSFELIPQDAGVFLISYAVTPVEDVYLFGLDAALFTFSGNVSMTENACAVAWDPVQGCAADDRLGELFVDENNTFAEFLFDPTGNTVYVRKDIQIHSNSSISDIRNSHHVIDERDVPEVPEPATMLLFSTALLGLGVLRRKKS